MVEEPYTEESDEPAPGPEASKDFGAMTLLVARGFLSPDNAHRIYKTMRILRRRGKTAGWSVTRLKGNPGEMLSEALHDHPQVMGDTKRKDAERVVAISETDFAALVAAAAQAAGPGFATGREMYSRLAQDRPPFKVTQRGLPRHRQPRMSIEDALSARPRAGGAESEGGGSFEAGA